MNANAPTGTSVSASAGPGSPSHARFDLDEPFAVQPDAHLAIASQPAERKVVQQLVGDDDVRSTFELGRDADAVDRRQRRTGARADVDRLVVHVEVVELAEDLGGERSVAGSHLGDAKRNRSAKRVVQFPYGASDQRTEHGMDVRARHEVLGRSHRRALVVAARSVEGQLHVLGERDRSVVADRPTDRLRDLFAHGEEYAARWRVSRLTGLDGVGGVVRQEAVGSDLQVCGQPPDASSACEALRPSAS